MPSGLPREVSFADVAGLWSNCWQLTLSFATLRIVSHRNHGGPAVTCRDEQRAGDWWLGWAKVQFQIEINFQPCLQLRSVLV